MMMNWLLAGFLSVALAQPADVTGRMVAAPFPEKDSQPWPAEWEQEYQRRGEAILKAQCARHKAAGLGGNTYFENEKRVYGFLLAHLAGGDRQTALKELQREDAQADTWHRHTKGIDYYACFTLPHQVRKYFLYGHLLEPAYKKRMFEGAKIWTEQDPLGRPHPAFVKEGDGWGPDVRNSWVDVRNTENLFLMRTSSVYLMAEETGNEATRKLYKQHILDYARAIYRVGMGEWDSENYHGHSMSSLLNLYDFAKDPQVKAAAKACLDYVFTVGAVNYFRGGYGGPSKRDYSHPQPFGGSAARMLWVVFGDCPIDNTEFEGNEVHILTSGYRPPIAVMHLARKHFDRPVELLECRPHYTASTTGDLKSPPEHLLTRYLGRTFHMGSVLGGSVPRSDLNAFKVLVFDKQQGALAIQCVPGPDPQFVGSPRYVEGKVSGPNRVAQNHEVAVWLVERGDSPWSWVLSKSIVLERERGIAFLRADRTWLAMHPVNVDVPNFDAGLTNALIGSNKDRASQWVSHQVLSAKGRGGKYCGFAVEVGEAPDFADYAAFKRAVLTKSTVDASELAKGVVGFTGAAGRNVKLQFAAKPAETKVWRDGMPHSLADHGKAVYRVVDGSPGLIEQDWLGGHLVVRAGGAVFSCSVDEKGNVTLQSE